MPIDPPCSSRCSRQTSKCEGEAADHLMQGVTHLVVSSLWPIILRCTSPATARSALGLRSLTLKILTLLLFWRMENILTSGGTKLVSASIWISDTCRIARLCLVKGTKACVFLFFEGNKLKWESGCLFNCTGATPASALSVQLNTHIWHRGPV